MDRNIFITAVLLVVVLFAGEYLSPVDARGGSGAGARGLARGDQITLENSISRSDDNVERVVNETHVNEMTRISCERRFNQSIDALTATLPHPNSNTTVGPTKNNSAYIEKWTSDAEKNQTDCLASGPHGGAFSVGFSAVSYGFCLALYFGFVMNFSPVFFV